MGIADRKVTAIIGPSGCGKSTLLRCFNRIHDLYPGVRYDGAIDLLPDNINLVGQVDRPDPGAAAGRHGVPEAEPLPQVDLRQRRGRPLRARHDQQDRDRRPGGAGAASRRRSGTRSRTGCTSRPTSSPAASSSGSASPARWPAEPKMLLLDEPTSALDPIATAKIEELIDELCKDVTVLIVTHNMQPGGADLALHRLHAPGRAGRVRPDRPDLHHARPSSRPRTTSPAATAGRAARASLVLVEAVDLQQLQPRTRAGRAHLVSWQPPTVERPLAVAA